MAKKFGKVFLHFGADKTGSTAIQTALSLNREFLLSKELLAYPPGDWHAMLGSYFCDQPEHYVYNVLSSAGDVDFLKSEAQKYFSEINDWLVKIKPCRYLVFSYEGFNDLDEKALTKFKNFCEEWSDVVKVIYYVRPPLSYAVSVMGQRVKQGLNSWVEGELPVSHSKFYIERFLSVFGKNNLIIRLFQKNFLEAGDVVSDILCLIGLVDVKLKPVDTKSNNESLSAIALQVGDLILKNLKKRGVNYSGNVFHRKYGNYLSKLKGPSVKLTSEQIELILNRTEDSTCYLSREFNLNFTEDTCSYLKDSDAEDLPAVLDIESTVELLVCIMTQSENSKTDFISSDFSLLSASPADRPKVQSGDEIIFTLVFSLAMPATELEIGIHITDENGGRAFGINTTLLNKKIMNVKPGTYRLQYHLAVDLPEGQYHAGFAFIAYDDPLTSRELAWFEQLLPFSVTLLRPQASIGYSSMPVAVECTQTSAEVSQLVADATGMLRFNGVLGAVVPNEVFSLQVSLENASTQTWCSLYDHSLTFSYHWQDLAGNYVIFEGERSPMPENSVPPGCSLSTVMTVQAPEQPGEYRLILLPVQERHGWFDQFGFTPATINVVVLQNATQRCYLGNDNRLFSQCGTRVGEALVATGEEGFLIYGPYITLPLGTYRIRLDLAMNIVPDGAWMDVSAAGGSIQFAKVAISPLTNQSSEVAIGFELKEQCDGIEVRLWVPAGCDLVVQSLLIESCDECIGSNETEVEPAQEIPLPEQVRISMISHELAEQVDVVQTPDAPNHIFKAGSVIGTPLARIDTFQSHKIDEVLDFLKTRFPFKPDLFVDIGGNIGTHLVHALKACGFMRGLAFEPDPLNYALMMQNITENGLADKVQAFKLALSSSSGATTIELCAPNFGDHRVRSEGVQPLLTSEENTRRVISALTDTGDKFFEENDLVLSSKTLIWMNAQGHEGHVFTGFKKLFSAHQKPFVVCEFWPCGLEGAGGKKMFFDFLGNCTVFYDINQVNWQEKPEISLGRLELLYQTMLSDTRDGYFSHTIILCVL